MGDQFLLLYCRDSGFVQLVDSRTKKVRESLQIRYVRRTGSRNSTYVGMPLRHYCFFSNQKTQELGLVVIFMLQNTWNPFAYALVDNDYWVAYFYLLRSIPFVS